MPTKLVACPRKCTLQVIQFASSDQPRFGIIKNYNKKGTAIIPDGFIAESISDGLTWVVMTRVDETGIVSFKCTCKTDETLTSNWVKTMSQAYKQANGNGSKNPNYKTGANGRIVFGLTYPLAQEEIRLRFGDAIQADPRLRLDHQASSIAHAPSEAISTNPSKKRSDSAGPVAEPPKPYPPRRQRRDKAKDQPTNDISSPPPPPPPRRDPPAVAVPSSSSSTSNSLLPSPVRQRETSAEHYSFDYPDLLDGVPLPLWMAKHVGM